MRWPFLAWALALVLVASCSGGGRRPPAPPPAPTPPPSPVPVEPPLPTWEEVDPAPEAFLEALVPAQRRPRLSRAFNVRIGPGIDPRAAWERLMTVVGMTDGYVGFAEDPGRPVEVDLLVDPAEFPPGQGGGATWVRESGQLITGARIVFSEPRWADAPVFMLHELGHLIGLEHTPGARGRRYVMSWESPNELDAFHDWERQAWRRLASRPVQPGAASPTWRHVCTTRK